MRSDNYPLFFAMILLLSAQQGYAQPLVRNTKALHGGSHVGASDHHAAARSDQPVLWSEHFENGLNGWAVATLQGNVSWQLTATGNIGGYTPGPLESTTGYPTGSWITADSDAHGMAGSPENTSILSPPILGLDTVHHMLMRFEQSFRQLNDDQTLVQVSGDGGDHWTNYPVNTDVQGNQMTPGAPESQVVTLNISDALSEGSSDIRIRFQWISTEGYTYSWQVDDIELIAALPNDIALEKATYAYWEPDGVNWAGMPCTIYPVNEQRELHFRGQVRNMGSNDQHNVRLRIAITGPDQYAELIISDPTTLAAGESAVLDIDGYTPPATPGAYAFHLSVLQAESDDAPEDNDMELGLRIDPFVFARDGGYLEGTRDNDGADFDLGNRFWIQHYDEQLQGVEVALGPGTDVGAEIEARVYDSDLNVIAQSELHAVVEEDINAFGGDHFLSLRLSDPTPLFQDHLYLITIHVYTSNGNAQVGLSGTSPAQTSLIYRSDVAHWYYVTSTPMVRMNFDPSVGIDPTSKAPITLTAQPSVFDDRTIVRFASASGESIQWELFDANGRRVSGAAIPPRGSAEQQLELTGDGLNEGMYLFKLSQGERTATLKLVHQARR